MHYTLLDQFRIVNKIALDDRVVERMRGIAWLIYAIYVSGLNRLEFAKRYVQRGRSDSGLVRKWFSGKSYPVRHSALQVEKLLPKTLWVFDLDMWELLKNVPISSAAVERIITKYTDGRYWSFPSEAGPRPGKRQVLAEIKDTQRLVYRGDFWGFVGALAIVRLYESSGNDLKYSSALKDMFRALPGALKEPWLRPLGEDLIDKLLALKARRFYISLMFGVDERIIFSQADDPAFEPHRDWRRPDPVTGKVVELDDPVILSKIVPSLGVRDRKGMSPLGVLGSKDAGSKVGPT